MDKEFLGLVFGAIIVVLLLMILRTDGKEAFKEPASGQGYVKFYDDFRYSNLIFEKRGSNPDDIKPRYLKHDYRGEIRSLDINLPEEGPPGRRVEIYAYYSGRPNGPDTSDFYNIFNIPERLYKAHPNLQHVTSVAPGERYRSNNIPDAKRFLIIVSI